MATTGAAARVTPEQLMQLIFDGKASLTQVVQKLPATQKSTFLALFERKNAERKESATGNLGRLQERQAALEEQEAAVRKEADQSRGEAASTVRRQLTNP